MSDLLGFDGFPNVTAPFNQYGYDVFWKSNITYLDFSFKNEYKEECEYPRFWNESGERVLATVDQKFSRLVGCFDSEFDQVSGPHLSRERCTELTKSSTATLKRSATFLTGSDSSRNSHRCRIACESGNRQSVRKSSIWHACSSVNSISMESASTKRLR